MTTFDSATIRVGQDGVRFGSPSLLVREKDLTFATGGGAASFAPFPAPAGWRWEFLYEKTPSGSNTNLADARGPLIDLVRAA